MSTEELVDFVVTCNSVRLVQLVALEISFREDTTELNATEYILIIHTLNTKIHKREMVLVNMFEWKHPYN